MRILIVFAARSGLCVLDCGQSDESLLVNVNSEWIDAHECHVNPQIELETIEEHRIVNVFTNNTALLHSAHVLKVIGKKDALTLRTGTRLHDVLPVWILLHGFLQFGYLVR